MQIIKKIITIGLVMLTLASCATQKGGSTRKHTMQQKAQVQLAFDQHQYNIACQLKAWRNELIVLSVLPMMGIEMFRLEATLEHITVVDKFNKRYAIVTYDEINQMATTHITFKYLQTLLKKGEDNISMNFAAGSHNLQLTAKLQQPEYNTLDEPQYINLKKYKQVNLRNILPI